LATAPQDGTRDGKKAIELATKACDLSSWKKPYTLDTLAAAYAETGDFENAVKWQRKCLDLANSNPSGVAGFRKRLTLYLAQKPFRENK
jgi:tetratricopeptide (TPR) repeat protein